MRSLMSPRHLACLAALLVCAKVAAADAAERPLDWVRLAIEEACGVVPLSGFDAQKSIPGSRLLEETAWPDASQPRRLTVRLATSDDGELLLEQLLVNGQRFRFSVASFRREGSELIPELEAIADGDCTPQSARAVRQGEGAWRYLDQLDGDLETLRWTETLQAPWPDGEDPGGPRVAFIDSGLAYDLPLFRSRLARGPDGTPIGFDFWDLDPWPYDGDVSRGAFFPIRHGTMVASVFVAEAPDAAIIPYRYPRPDMSRLATAVAKARNAGARVVAMPLGSRRIEDWAAFEDALRTHDVLAIVSAGNNGVDIDQTPIYPAALPLENMITVTSSDAFGRLAEGSNWGAQHVDIMLPAENVEVVDIRGASGTASGSSYAVPRLAALAARILSAQPDLTIEELKARIFARAVPAQSEQDKAVAIGWIADPLAE